MEHCKYHPIVPASYACRNCHTTHCEQCIDEGSIGLAETCFNCKEEVESLGAMYTAKPFWRRIEASFKYPLNTHTAILIVVVSFFNTILDYVPFTVIWQLALFGTMIKYCFDCLENTAKGNLQAPEMDSTFSGFQQAKEIILLFLALIASVFAVGWLLGSNLAAMLSFFYMLGIPAILINYSFNQSILFAINPVNTFNLIKAIGIPYGLIIGFMIIMSASVASIQGLIGYDLSVLTGVLQSIISYYYMIVMFHLLGYMVFQYQGQLGFVARDETQKTMPRSITKKLDAKIAVLVKEGEYEKAKIAYIDFLKYHQDDRHVNRKYFEFLIACKDIKGVKDFATDYFVFLIQTKQQDKLSFTYKRVLALVSDFEPLDAAIRHKIAQECAHEGSYKLVLQLINGLLKKHPEYPELAECYQLMLDSLRQLPNMESQIERCAALVVKLKKHQTRLSKNQPTVVSQNTAKSDNPPDITTTASQTSDKSHYTPKSDGVATELPPLEFKL